MPTISRRLLLTGLAVGLLVGSGLFLFLPPSPRLSWPVKGDRFFLSPDSRRLAVVHVVYPKVKPQLDVLSSGGGPMPERSDIAVYDLATGRLIVSLSWEDHVEIRSLAFSPDGRRLAALNVWSGALREWEIPTGNEITRLDRQDLEELSIRPRALAYSPANHLRVLTEWKGEHYLWSVAQAEVEAKLASKEDMVEVDTSVPGFVMAFDKEGKLKAWRLQTGVLTGTFAADTDGFSMPPHITLSADGSQLVYGTRKSVEIWGEQGEPRRLPLNVASYPKLSPDSRRLLAFAWHDLRGRRPGLLERVGLLKPPRYWHTMTLYDLDDGAELGAFPDTRAADFTPDGQHVAVLTDEDIFQLWDGPPRPPWLKIIGIASLASVLTMAAARLRRSRRQT